MARMIRRSHGQRNEAGMRVLDSGASRATGG